MDEKMPGIPLRFREQIRCNAGHVNPIFLWDCPDDAHKLKLYLWTGVLCDHSCGLVAVLATSAEEARIIVATGEPFAGPSAESIREAIDGREPIELRSGYFGLYGGG